MPQSLSNITLHVVFSTKNRHPWLISPIRESLHAYMATVVRGLDRCECYRAGGVEDHVHLAIRLARAVTVADLVERIKTTSSRWLKGQDASLKQFAWQKGYGAFSVFHPHLHHLLHYIDGQEEHHRKVTFQDEYRQFLKEYEVDHDERYVWD